MTDYWTDKTNNVSHNFPHNRCFTFFDSNCFWKFHASFKYSNISLLAKCTVKKVNLREKMLDTSFTHFKKVISQKIAILSNYCSWIAICLFKIGISLTQCLGARVALCLFSIHSMWLSIPEESLNFWTSCIYASYGYYIFVLSVILLICNRVTKQIKMDLHRKNIL